MFLEFIVLFILLCFLSFIPTKKNRDINIVFSSVGLLLFLFAAFRDGDYIDSRGVQLSDYDVYISYFNHYQDALVEPTFKWISQIIHSFDGGYIFLFCIYAFLGLYCKFLAISKLSTLVLSSVLVYVSRFFMLHEMTQIRIGVASGLVLLSYIYIYEKNIKKFLFFVLLATMFHVSALLVIPFYYFNCHSINKRLYGFLIPLSYVFYFTGIKVISLLKLLPINFIQAKIDTYLELQEIGDSVASDINVFNWVHIVQCIIAYLLLNKVGEIAKYNSYAYLLIKIYIYALAFYVFFATFPVLAGRGKELFLIVEIIVIPWLTYLFKPRMIAKSIVVAYAIIIMGIVVFYDKIIPI